MNPKSLPYTPGIYAHLEDPAAGRVGLPLGPAWPADAEERGGVPPETEKQKVFQHRARIDGRRECPLRQEAAPGQAAGVPRPVILPLNQQALILWTLPWPAGCCQGCLQHQNLWVFACATCHSRKGAPHRSEEVSSMNAIMAACHTPVLLPSAKQCSQDIMTGMLSQALS